MEKYCIHQILQRLIKSFRRWVWLNEGVIDHTSSAVGSRLLKYLPWLLYSSDYTQFSYVDDNSFCLFFWLCPLLFSLRRAALFSQRTSWGEEVLLRVNNAGGAIRQKEPGQVVPGGCGEQVGIWRWEESHTPCTWSGRVVSQVGGEPSVPPLSFLGPCPTLPDGRQAQVKRPESFPGGVWALHSSARFPFLRLLTFLCMLSCFSRVWLSVTPWTAARQAPLSTGFSRQEYWSGLPCSRRGSSWPGDWTRVFYVSCTGRWVLYH